MGRRALILLLVAAPAVALGALGVVVIASATAQQGAATFGVPTHFASRQVFALVLAALVAIALVQLGIEGALRAAPVIFLCAFGAALAVFAPGVGVHAAGANRWVHVGPWSGNPAPLLTAGTAMLMAAWATRGHAAGAAATARRLLALGLGAAAVLTFVAEPDFSSAAITALVILVALAGGGFGGRRLVPAAAATLLALALVASRFGYVGGRISGFLSPHSDRRGKGFEVLALARAQATATRWGVGLGHGVARHRLSSPGSDYVFAIVTEEMGRLAAGAVVAAWAAVGAGAWLAARGTRDPRLRAGALAAGAAALAPAALHVAVCQGWVPIIGVSMPLLSYDPAATVATGAELGLIAAVALSSSNARTDDA
jgi:cell division protein FtsW (lipid II flippase)